MIDKVKTGAKLKCSVLLLFVSLGVSGLAQVDSGYRYTFMERNFFRQFGGSVISEFGSTPFTYRTRQIYDPGTGQYRDTIEARTNSYITLVSATYEARVNLVNFQDWLSLSLAVPATVAISAFTGDDGAIHVKLPVIADINLFNHSTFSNIDYFGVHFGAGQMLTVGPLIHGGDYDYETVWISTVYRAGVKFLLRGKNSYFNVTYGPGNFVRDSDGDKVTEKYSLLLSLGTLINYD